MTARHAAQSMFQMMMVSAFAVSAFAQDTGLPTMPVIQPAAAAAAPATQLPPVTVPAISVPVTAATATAATPEAAPSAAPATAPAPTAATAAVPAEPPKVFSYGTSPATILFLPAQADRMRQAIHTYESTGKSGTTSFVAAEPLTIAAPVEPAKIDEPASYPVFYLSSIVYHSPRDWSLWVSGHRIASYKNDTDLTVLGVTPDSATFSWKPTYMTALKQRTKQKIFAATDPVQHRMLRQQNIKVSDTDNTVTFTLHTNQSFAAGYFAMFEGYVATPAMPKLDTAKDAKADSAAPVEAPVVAVAPVDPKAAVNAAANAEAIAKATATLNKPEVTPQSLLPSAQDILAAKKDKTHVLEVPMPATPAAATPGAAAAAPAPSLLPASPAAKPNP
jgi:hypothetical protein